MYMAIRKMGPWILWLHYYRAIEVEQIANSQAVPERVSQNLSVHFRGSTLDTRMGLAGLSLLELDLAKELPMPMLLKPVCPSRWTDIGYESNREPVNHPNS